MHKQMVHVKRMYIVLQQVHVNMRITNQAMNVIHGMIHSLALRIIQCMAELHDKENFTHAIAGITIQNSIQLLFPCALRRHSVSEGL